MFITSKVDIYLDLKKVANSHIQQLQISGVEYISQLQQGGRSYSTKSEKFGARLPGPLPHSLAAGLPSDSIFKT